MKQERLGLNREKSTLKVNKIFIIDFSKKKTDIFTGLYRKNTLEKNIKLIKIDRWSNRQDPNYYIQGLIGVLIPSTKVILEKTKRTRVRLDRNLAPCNRPTTISSAHSNYLIKI